MSDAFASLTPQQLATMPAGTPPPGVIPNLVDPETRGPVMIIVGSIMMVLMLVLASLRYYTKLIIVGKTTWDDYTCGAALFGTILYFIICCYAVTVGKIGTHLWDISLAHLLGKQFQISGYLINFVSAVIWPFAKMSFFILYLQLFRPLIWLRRMIYFGAFVNVAFYTSIVIVTLYYTTPAPHESWAETYLSSRYAGTFNTTIPIASGSLAIDLYIFLLPILGISNLNMSPRRKLGIMIVFATGLTACIASSLSIYYKTVLDSNIEDYTYAVLPVSLMALVEMCIGISASCMPALANLIRNGENWTVWRTKLSTTFRSLTTWRSSSREVSAASKPTNISPSTYGPYSNLDNSRDHELKGVDTFIRRGSASSNGNVGEDGIHLEYGISREVWDQRSIPVSGRKGLGQG